MDGWMGYVGWMGDEGRMGWVGLGWAGAGRRRCWWVASSCSNPIYARPGQAEEGVRVRAGGLPAVGRARSGGERRCDAGAGSAAAPSSCGWIPAPPMKQTSRRTGCFAELRGDAVAGRGPARGGGVWKRKAAGWPGDDARDAVGGGVRAGGGGAMRCGGGRSRASVGCRCCLAGLCRRPLSFVSSFLSFLRFFASSFLRVSAPLSGSLELRGACGDECGGWGAGDRAVCRAKPKKGGESMKGKRAACLRAPVKDECPPTDRWRERCGVFWCGGDRYS